MTKTTIEVPKDLNQYAKTQAFIDVSSAYKSDDIRSRLDELEVGYLASDNKAELVYRLLVAQGQLPILSDDDEDDFDDFDPVAEEVAEVAEVAAEPVADDAVVEPVAEVADDAVVVESTHYRNLIEPATGTMIPPQTRTKIYPTAYVSRERIISNLEQIMFLHRDMLQIVGGGV